jgi:hypothetical protein
MFLRYLTFCLFATSGVFLNGTIMLHMTTSLAMYTPRCRLALHYFSSCRARYTASSPGAIVSRLRLLNLRSQVLHLPTPHIRQRPIISLLLTTPLSPRNISRPLSSILRHPRQPPNAALERPIRAQPRPIALPPMTKHLKVIVNKPLQILALGP